MLALAAVAGLGIVLAGGGLATHRWLRRRGTDAVWQTRLARSALVAAGTLVALSLVAGPLRWRATAADAPKGPGGKTSLTAEVDDDLAVQRELVHREVASLTGRLPAVTFEDVRVEDRITGQDGVNDTADRWNVHGTDLGHFIEDGDRLHLVFGDTFGPGGLGGEDWRSNVMATVPRGDLDRLRFDAMIADETGHAGELLASKKVDGLEKTVIPTYGIADGGRLYLHYMSVRTWKGPGRWVVNHAGLAYSDDDGRSWTKDPDRRWRGDGNFAQVAFVRDDGWIYLFGIPAGRFGPAQLARVRPGRLLEREAYRYWDGEAWTPDIGSAAPVVPGPVGELSVAWHEELGVWVMLYLDQPREGIVVRTAKSLTGAWSEPELVVSAADLPTLYGPFIVPGSMEGDRIAFTLSRYDRYNVFLVRASLAARGTRPLAPG